MKRIFFMLFLWFFLLFFSHSVSAETYTCLVCHSSMKGKIRTERGALLNVNVDSEKYSQSVHGGFDCITCHKQFGPNPHEPIKANVSSETASLASKISHKAKVDPIALAACKDCHDDTYKSWMNSEHGTNIITKKQTDGASCIDCHGSAHYIKKKEDRESLVNRKQVVKTCGSCHEKKELAEKYKYGTHILERYYESFHGKKYVIGHPNAPTCVDCHSYHDIKKWDDPASPVAMQNRTETCGKCHKGATKKFVTSITHKPIGKDNPIPYYFGKGLTLLLLSVFVFITGHVILEAIAEIRDRVLKKKGGQ
jgi:nitrate/TMAO reductase-like tetraheme cytochrome c subunit